MDDFLPDDPAVTSDQPDLLQEEDEEEDGDAVVKQEEEEGEDPNPEANEGEDVGEDGAAGSDDAAAGQDEEQVDDGNEDEEDDEDDDEDDVQINIGDYKPGSLSLTPGPININMKKGPAAAKTKVAAVDLNAEGTVNGESIYDFNVDSIDEKPWTKPGADITDYFNYGFTEDTWKLYCLKQRKLRMELAEEGSGMSHQSSGPSNQRLSRGDYVNNRALDSIVNENSKYSGQQLKTLGAGPPPGRKPSGAIDVIGTQSGGIPSRRPLDQNEYDGNPGKIQVLSRPPPLGPPPPFNLNMPPPHLMHGMDGGPFIPRMPPPGMMPPNGQPMPFHPDFHSGMPPRFMPPPPMMNESPRGYNDDFDDVPDDRDRGYGSYMMDRGGQRVGSRGGYDSRSGYRGDEGDFRRGPPPPTHPFDRRDMDPREFEIREYADQMDRRPERDDRCESKDVNDDSRSSRSRSHHRDRDRDHESKSRDKDTDRESSSSSKRRHHDDDSKSSSSSSRHKHSKRSRRDKDNEESSSSKH